jgi:hypothetical protein
MPLVVPPSSGVGPSLAVSYSSNGGDGVLGMGFSISGASSIVRCPKTRAIDGPDAEIGTVHYDADDALCLDGKRLVIVAQNGDSRELRTFPDSMVKVVQHLATSNESYFEAFLPSGWVVKYGTNAGSLPRARNGAPRAWLASEMRNARGSKMTYGYCFAEGIDLVYPDPTTTTTTTTTQAPSTTTTLAVSTTTSAPRPTSTTTSTTTPIQPVTTTTVPAAPSISDETPPNRASGLDLDLAKLSGVTLNMAAEAPADLGFRFGVNPVTGLTVDFSSVVEVIKAEFLSAVGLGTMVAFFAVGGWKREDEEDVEEVHS